MLFKKKSVGSKADIKFINEINVDIIEFKSKIDKLYQLFISPGDFRDRVKSRLDLVDGKKEASFGELAKLYTTERIRLFEELKNKVFKKINDNLSYEIKDASNNAAIKSVKYDVDWKTIGESRPDFLN